MPLAGFAKSSSFNGHFGMDDFRAEAAAAVPEPSPLLLLPAGLGLGLFRARFRRDRCAGG